MGVRTVLVGLTLSWLLASAAVAADFNKGLRAARLGTHILITILKILLYIAIKTIFDSPHTKNPLL